MAGKGSKPRPYSVDRKKFEENWELAFSKKKEPSEEYLDAYNEERLVSKYDKTGNNTTTGIE
jgi:hypothetical protein